MSQLKLYYATNRKHKGRDRWSPTGYGPEFSSDGMENLRFGKLTVSAEAARITRHVNADIDFGKGDGNALAGYLTSRARSPRSRKIDAFAEKLEKDLADSEQAAGAHGSTRLFAELQDIMCNSSDVIIFIHGYNVEWEEAAGSALALQSMLNRKTEGDPLQKVAVVLFSWPSDGSSMPFAAYKSDRSDAKGSGAAVGRAFLKLRDFLMKLRALSGSKASGVQLCDQQLHLLCHSMGNYVLQNALARMAQFTPGVAMPRLFDHVFLCAADVDDEVLEMDKPMGRLHELTRNVTVYFNSGDAALHISDFTKGNPERLGTAGAARPSLVHSKIHQVDCSPVVSGIVEHSYFLDGDVNRDIRMSLANLAQDDPRRTHREQRPTSSNTWAMRPRG